MSRSWTPPGRVLPALLALSLAAPALAQSSDSQPPDARTLAARLAKLRQELAQERAREAERVEERAKELAERKRTRDELAERLLAGEETRLALEAERAKLATQAKSLRGRVGTLERAQQPLVEAGTALAEQLRLALGETPGADAAQARWGDVLDGLEQTSAGQGPDPATVWSELFQLAGTEHAGATGLGVQRCELVTAGGLREQVELLSVGRVAFAYRTPDGRFGLALASPQDAAGLRWSEGLPPEQAQALARTFEALADGRAGVVAPALDVTRRLPALHAAHEVLLVERLRAGGPTMVPLGLVALLALLLAVERAWFYRRQRSAPRLLADCLAACRAGESARALTNCTEGRGVNARVLAACLRQRARGRQAMEDGISEQLLYEQPALQKRLGGLAVLGAVAPLLGLLGTVTGIIQTFGVIQVFGNANPGLLAGGISEALITTATGLIIAIPIVLVHALLTGRADQLLSQAEQGAATLLVSLIDSDSRGSSSESESESETESASETESESETAPESETESESALAREVPQ